jgi:hypothetical protein
MAANYHALPEGPAMRAPATPANSSTFWRAAVRGIAGPSHEGEEDLALGCECANPALQIEVWRHEAAAQPQIVTVPVLQAVPA